MLFCMHEIRYVCHVVNDAIFVCITNSSITIIMAHPLYSFVYILVSTDGLVKPDKSTISLAYQEATDSGLVYYVAAALSYTEYSDSNIFTLGNGKRTDGLNGQQFTNVKLNTGTTYYYFIRAYSVDYTEEVTAGINIS